MNLAVVSFHCHNTSTPCPSVPGTRVVAITLITGPKAVYAIESSPPPALYKPTHGGSEAPFPGFSISTTIAGLHATNAYAFNPLSGGLVIALDCCDGAGSGGGAESPPPHPASKSRNSATLARQFTLTFTNHSRINLRE